jgi:enoyl-CoA hydratase
MACDIRLASENARFSQPEVTLAILPGSDGTQQLARLIGKGRALEMIMTGRLMDLEEAFATGLVSRVVPLDELVEVVKQTAGTHPEEGATRCQAHQALCTSRLGS